MPFGEVDLRVMLAQVANLALADGTNWLQLLSADAYGGRVVAWSAASSSATDRTLEVRVNRQSVYAALGSVVVPAGAGRAGVPAVDVLAAIRTLPDGDLLLGPFWTLECRITLPLIGGTLIELQATGGSF